MWTDADGSLGYAAVKPVESRMELVRFVLLGPQFVKFDSFFLPALQPYMGTKWKGEDIP